MFASAFSIVLLLVSLASVTVALPYPYHVVERRQIGDLQCNLNRLGIVGDLSALGKNVDDMATATSGDATLSPLVASAQDGVNNATAGIKTIAQSLFTGQAAPADARDQVQSGLEAVGTALGQISAANSTDTSVTTPLAAAQTNLQKATTAGKNVVADCN